MEDKLTDDNLLGKKKKELDENMAGAAKEIELLKRRQSELENRKKQMEEISVKQQEYENKKREIILKLSKSIVLLEKEEVRAAKLVELLSDTREQFKSTLDDIKSIDESTWNSNDFEELLNDAIVRVNNAIMLHKKSLGKVDVLVDKTNANNLRDINRMVEDAETIISDGGHSFGYWLKAGIAFSLPMMTIIIILFVIYLFLNGVI